MSNELATLKSNSLIGQFMKTEEEVSLGAMPFVTITETAVTVKGKAKIVGAFKVGNQEEAPTFETLEFRPLATFYQYLKWSDDQKSVAARTALFDDWQAEHVSTDGLIMCGRPKKAAFIKLSDEKQKQWKKDVPVYMHIFGLVEIDGEDKLVDFKVRGGKILEFGNTLKYIKGKRYYSKQLICTVEKSKDHPGYDLNLEIDDNFNLSDPNEVLPFFQQIQQFVQGDQATVMALYKKANNEKQEEMEISESIIDAEVDDELPL